MPNQNDININMSPELKSAMEPITKAIVDSFNKSSELIFKEVITTGSAMVKNGELVDFRIPQSFGITPTNDLVIIRKHSVEDLKSPMGILLPPVEESADTPWKGTVVAVGPGKPAKLSGAGENVVKALEMVCKQYNVTPDQNWGALHWQVAAAALKENSESIQRVPMQISVGDVVVFSRNGHQTFQINGEVVFCMGEASILGVIDDE